MTITGLLISCLIGILIGSFTLFIYKRYLNMEEDKQYIKELNETFNRENITSKKVYEERKIAFENNVGKQLDINKIRTDKEENKVLKEAEKRNMLQTINKYKEILKENKIC